MLGVNWQIVVNAIVDTLKTAFPRSEPQSPTEDVDAEPDGKLPSDKKSKYVDYFPQTRNNNSNLCSMLKHLFCGAYFYSVSFCVQVQDAVLQ